MIRITKSLLFLLFALISFSFGEDREWVKNFYFKDAQPIVLRDPLLHQFGVAADDEKALRVVHLHDLVNMHGHLCPEVMSAYVIPTMVIEKLYSREEVPLVGDIKMTTPSYDGLYDEVASALRLESDSHHGPQTWFKSDNQEKSDVLTFVFDRISNSTTVEVTFDKKSFLKRHVDMKAYRKLKSKILAGKASKEEKEEFASKLKKMMDDLYRNRDDIFAIKMAGK